MKQLWQRIDPNSLQVRLTLGVTAVAIFGISGVAAWTTLRTRQILINSHKQNIHDVAARFAQDVVLYSDMMPIEEAVQRAVEVRTLPNLLVLVRDVDSTIGGDADRDADRDPITQSDLTWPEPTMASILALPAERITPQVVYLDGRYVVLCSEPLVVDNVALGQLYVAQDITTDQMMFATVIRSLSVATVLAILGITILIAWYVRRSLRPLRRVSQMTQTVSVENLGQVKLQLESAPTEVTELVQTCEHMLMRLSESWEQQRQFFHDVSHELRTPLTVVYGYLQSTLRRSQTLSDSQREALEIAAAEADRTIRLLQDLLDLARADSGHIHFTLEPLRVHDLLLEVAGMAEQYSDRPILLEADGPNVTVKADRCRLKQVLLNLTDNALKYSDPAHPVILRLQHQGDWVKLQVADRGCGIPLSQQQRIFDRFYRVDEARARSTGGCGLGLAIVKSLVEGMGGKVTVHSQLNEGSIFTVTLPCA